MLAKRQLWLVLERPSREGLSILARPPSDGRVFNGCQRIAVWTRCFDSISLITSKECR